MKMFTFAKRCFKEILRDPINLFFGLGFPLILLFLLSTLQKNIPVPLFEINTLTPGIAVFGLSFMTLFSASLISKDKETSFLQRLYSTPLTSIDFILGYMIPLLPIALGQITICYLVAIPLGLTVSVNIIFSIIGMIPMAVFNIALGLLFGSLLGVKQVGGICGALLSNITAWLSGVWFDLNLMGETFKNIANFLPFVHATEMAKAFLNDNFNSAFNHMIPVVIYSLITVIVSVICYLNQMKKQ